MPCCDGGRRYGYDDGTQKRLDKVTRYLCRVLKQIEEQGLLHSYTDTNIRTWWEEHKEVDRRRIEEENREKEAKRRKRAALDKLTPDEKKLLGL